MKPTNESIAREARAFGVEDDDGFIVINSDKEDGFNAGAIWMRSELTRWHDPKEELPDYYHPVEIKYLHSQFIEVAIAWLGVIDDGAYIWTIDNTDKAFFHDEILGWREILE